MSPQREAEIKSLERKEQQLHQQMEGARRTRVRPPRALQKAEPSRVGWVTSAQHLLSPCGVTSGFSYHKSVRPHEILQLVKQITDVYVFLSGGQSNQETCMRYTLPATWLLTESTPLV